MAGSRLPAGCQLRRRGHQLHTVFQVADAVELRLFDSGDAGATETRVRLPDVDGFVWPGYLPDVGPVDGFRSDLASTLAREFYDVDRLSTFFDLVQQDPMINQVKLIAEPWDVGPGGYQVGNFPPLWTEWNGKYRDTVPNDGFTLIDLVSYNDKRNEANDPEVLALRGRQRHNMLATLFLSQGIPMLHGDELGRTPQGNNNVYCQGNELSWVDWSAVDEELVTFTAGLIALRRDHPVFRRRRFFAGRPIRVGDELRDIAWFTESGEEMTGQDWEVEVCQCLTVFLNGEGIPDADARGQQVTDNSFLLCFNTHHKDTNVDTATAEPPGTRGVTAAGEDKITITARSLIVLERTA